jgi:hypothetical protein|tara:strand:- start:14 stop:247 length:234 start_codon:yes stop_codon:yes gene_type:complete
MLDVTAQEIQERCEIGTILAPVRFFINGWHIIDGESDYDIIECTEAEFIENQGPIDYERHTVFANGCRQICLTKLSI